MKKLWNTLWLLTVSGLSLAAYVFFYAQFLLQNPLHSRFELNFPVFAVQDAAGNRYVIDNSRRRVSKITPAGEVVYHLTGGQKSAGTFFYAEEITVDKDGYLYLLNYIADLKGFYLQREEILRFTPQGQYDSTVYQKNYSREEHEATLVQRGRVFSLHVEAGVLSWFHVDGTGMTEYTFADKKLSPGFTYALADADMVVGDIARMPGGGAVYSAKDGRIKRIFPDGRERTLFAADKAKALSGDFIVPWELVTDAAGTVYFIDLAGRAVRRVEAPGRAPVVLDPEIIGTALGREAVLFDYYRLSIATDNTLVTCNDEAVVVHGASLHYLTQARIPLLWRVHIVLTKVALLLALLTLTRAIWLAYVYLFGKQIPPLLMMSLGIVGIVGLVAGFSAYQIVGNFSKRYQDVVLEKISQIVQLTPRVLDGDRFAGLRDQSDFNNADYRYIRHTLYDALNHNRDKWNEGYYFALYRVIDERLYGLMYLNGRIGMYMPFDWLDDGGVYDQALAGQIAVEVTTDISGDWIYGVGPITDSNGKVVALFETGTDLYYLRLENQRLLKELMLNLITVLVILVLLLIELSYFNDSGKRRHARQETFSDVMLVRPLSFLFFIAISMSVAFIPLLMKQFYVPVAGFSQEMLLALPLSLEMLFFGIATLIAGSLSHRAGWRPTLYAGFVFTSMGLALSALADDMAGLNLARAVTGFGSGLGFIGMRALLNREQRADLRSRGFSHFYAGMIAGINVGTVFGAALAQRIGFSHVFWVGLGVLCLALLFQQIYLRRPRYVEARSRAASDSLPLTAAFKLFFLNGRNMIFFIAIILPTYIAGTFYGYYFPLFAESEGLSVANIGLLLIFSGLFVIYLGPALSASLERSLGVYKSMILGSLLWGAALILFGLTGNLTGAVLALVLMGITEGFCVVAQNEFFLRASFIPALGENRAIGYFELMSKIAETAGPLVFAAALVLGASLGLTGLGLGIIFLTLVFMLLVRDDKSECQTLS